MIEPIIQVHRLLHPRAFANARQRLADALVGTPMPANPHICVFADLQLALLAIAIASAQTTSDVFPDANTYLPT